MIRAASALVLAVGLAGAAVVPASPAVDPTPAATPAASPSPSPTPTADPVRSAEYWLASSGVSEAWKTSKGKGVKIAVIDSGIARVPELDGAVVGGTDVSTLGDAQGRKPVGVVDANHGTWVASLAAARGTSATKGMVGVAPEADLLSISMAFGSTAPVSTTKQVAEAMRWAVDNGADVINLSFTTNSTSWDPSWDTAFQYAYDHDVVVVAAAGNRGSGSRVVGAPATIPGVLTVGGVDTKGVVSKGASTQGITIGVSAPSEKLLGVSSDGSVAEWEGTSGAAPIVAGVVALVRAAHPDLSADDVINRVISTAKPAKGASAHPDVQYGYGLIDAAAAVKADFPSIDHNPMGSLTEWVRLNRRAEAEPEAEPTVGPVVIEPLPAADGRALAGSPLLPTRQTVFYGTFPLIAVTVPGILIVLGVNAAVRRIRSARASRTSSK